MVNRPDQDAESVAKDFRWRYLNDPDLAAQVHVGAMAIMGRWEARNVTNTMLSDTAWGEAKLLAYTVLKAIDAARNDGHD